MKALLKKDLYMTLPSYIMIIILIPVFYLFFPSTLFIYIAYFYSVIWGLAYYDQQDRVNIFLASLPVKKQQIVLARYLFSIISGAAIGIYCYGIDNIVRLFRDVDAPPLTLETLFVTFCIGVILIAFGTPFFFRFSFNAAFGAQIIAGMVLFTILTLIARYVMLHEIYWIIDAAIFIFEHFTISIGVFALVSIIISYFLSRTLFINRDLA